MDKEPEPTLGAHLLRKWRDGQGITQAVACLRVGVDFSAYSKIENGKRVPGLKLAKRIADGTRGSVPIGAWMEEAKPRSTRRKAA